MSYWALVPFIWQNRVKRFLDLLSEMVQPKPGLGPSLSNGLPPAPLKSAGLNFLALTSPSSGAASSSTIGLPSSSSLTSAFTSSTSSNYSFSYASSAGRFSLLKVRETTELTSPRHFSIAKISSMKRRLSWSSGEASFFELQRPSIRMYFWLVRFSAMVC